MRRSKLLPVLILACLATPAHALPIGATPATVAACFVPAESCVGSIATAIGQARDTVRVQAYGFTSAPIIQALLDARRRGVDVRVILDKVNDRSRKRRKSRYSGATALANAGIPTFIDFRPAIAHNKVIVIDGHLVIGGSYNYTNSADRRNAENVTFIDSPVAAGWFSENWRSRLAQSRPFVPPADPATSHPR